jgi:lipopolysaccharide/colanic/teichoic acid biosynthesis glycosyltransferase
MSITAVLVDWRPAYLRAAGDAASLLLAPLGDGTLLAHVREQVAAAEAHQTVVLPNFEHGAAYRRAVERVVPDARLVAPAELRAFLDNHEPADWLLLVDTRHIPAGGYEFRVLLRDIARSRVIKHLVPLEHNVGGTLERVICDEQQRVRGIQRLYTGVTHLSTTGVAASLITVALARHLAQPEELCLGELRARLAAQGVPTHDLPWSGQHLDLTEATALLALNERFTLDAAERTPQPGFTRDRSGAWLAAGARLAPGARICGPVILHAGAWVQEGAVVIGPTVVGADAVVERGAVVSQCLLLPQTQVAAQTCCAHEVVVPGTASAAAPPTPRPTPALVVLPEAGGRRGNGRTAQPRAARQRRAYELAKRIFDFQAALFGLLLLAPLLLAVAALVRLTSGGPIFFGHEREGRGGRVFRCWKFRTMVADAHQQQRALYRQNAVDGPQFKMSNDPRITWLGHWLRTTNIDELPQLFNVLRGDMSLIGPRPSPFRENQICIPWRNARLSVRPGITGLWQVCRAERSAGDFHQWIHFDILYVRHLSFGLDVRILLATIWTLGGRWSVPAGWMIPARVQRLRRPDAWRNGHDRLEQRVASMRPA